MAQISAFKGILYNREKIKDIKDVVAPPYDVISPQEQTSLYNRHENNVVRLILGKELHGDTLENNRYTRSKAFFESWQRDGILIRDNSPSLYIYAQEYPYLSDPNRAESFVKKKRIGFIALSKIEDFGKGGIYPHENTLSKPKEDRLMLIRKCNANFSPIFGLFSDTSKAVDLILEDNMKQNPLYDFLDDTEMRHTLWTISENMAIQTIIKEMNDKQIFIADGHHRYETAINYRNEMRGKESPFTGDEPYNYVMMYFTNTESEGLSILPIHRVVHNLKDFDRERMHEKVGKFFNIESFSFNGNRDEEMVRLKFFSEMKGRREKGPVFGVYYGNNSYHLLTIKDEEIMDRFVTGSRPSIWKRLDVTILHTLLIEKTLGISDRNLREQNYITYTTNKDEAIKWVKDGKYQIAFFLNPTKIEDVQAIAKAGEKMPQKSTFFYPKLISGLVMNKLE
ncbi:MAG: DUF1015 domain-containing protein [Nitrospinota bacterium]